MRFRAGNFLGLDSTAVAASLLTFVASFWCGDLGNAAEVQVFSSPALRGVVNDIGRQFEGATGHTLVAEFEVFSVLKRRIDAGEAFDIAIFSPDIIDDLINLRKIAPDTRADLGGHGIGLGVRTGLPKPDISSVDAFKHAMLKAMSVAYFKGGTAGLHFLSILDRLGITMDMTSKLKAYDTPGVMQALAKGDAEFVVAGIGGRPAMPAAPPSPSSSHGEHARACAALTRIAGFFAHLNSQRGAEKILRGRKLVPPLQLPAGAVSYS
jgi:molybdate transport system substrate-binding protein